MAIGMRGGTGGIPTWMAFRRQLETLPTYDNRPTVFRGLRIPRPPPALEGATPAGLLCWGSAGELPSPTPLPTVSVNIKWPNEFWSEKWRDSQLVRIENPDDPEQHVNVKRAKESVFEVAEDNSKPGPNTATGNPIGFEAYFKDNPRWKQVDDGATSGTKKFIKVNYEGVDAAPGSSGG